MSLFRAHRLESALHGRTSPLSLQKLASSETFAIVLGGLVFRQKSQVQPPFEILRRPEGSSPLSIPFGKTQCAQRELDIVVHKYENLSEHLQSAEYDPHVAVTLLRFCTGPC